MRRPVSKLSVLLFFLVPLGLLAAPQEKWLHVKVTSRDAKGEVVRINLPLSLAVKVLPSITSDELHAGKLALRNAKFKGMDLRALAEAVREAPDGEFVKVDDKEESVLITKTAGDVLIKVRGKKQGGDKVDVKIPAPVVAALFSGPQKDEVDLVAGVRALEACGDATLVSVDDESDSVRIWVDSRNTAD